MSSVSVHVRTPVLIVGAGPVGLALAIELGSRGIPCRVVERNDRVGYAPRAKTTHVRTREHLRRWGIADRLAAASPFGIDYPSNVIFVTRLSGPKLAQFENAFHCAPARNPLYSEHAQWIPQYRLEEVLRAHAQSLPDVEICFNTEFVSCEQDALQVRTLIRDLAAGTLTTVASEFLVGADGARSAVRAAIGARMEGDYGLSRNYNIVFRASGLAAAHPHGPGIMYWHVNPDAPGLLGPMDQDDKWFFMPTRIADGVKLSNADAAAMIRTATGIDLPYEILSSDEWVASRLIADRYRDRRVFLAGDACHLHPPFGGYGMNMGIADAVDLGWKLAGCMQRWGGPGLLESYTRERRPVHEYVMNEAVANHSVLANQLWRPGLDDATAAGEAVRTTVGAQIMEAKAREFHTLGVVLGYYYDASPIVVADGSEPPILDSRRYIPSGRPGCVAPHAWLVDGRSLYDCFGSGFTLLVFGEDHDADVTSAREHARRLGVPLHVVRIQEAGIRELYQATYALIRPDQHVAWRGNSAPDSDVLKQISGNG
jgi:2-polyprenyl-6-methoxyphenol hydroxylase-like FAD-dependent oxidoreductase